MTKLRHSEPEGRRILTVQILRFAQDDDVCLRMTEFFTLTYILNHSVLSRGYEEGDSLLVPYIRSFLNTTVGFLRYGGIC